MSLKKFNKMSYSQIANRILKVAVSCETMEQKVIALIYFTRLLEMNKVSLTDHFKLMNFGYDCLYKK